MTEKWRNSLNYDHGDNSHVQSKYYIWIYTLLDDYLYRSDCSKNWWEMSTIDYDKAVHLIVHGQRDLIDSIKHKLASLGFADEKLVPASLQETGSVGEYVAMAWPPMHATEIILSEITGLNQGESKNNVMGAWSNISQKEISRIPLSWINIEIK